MVDILTIGDSITAGAPGWSPDASGIGGHGCETSQWQYWVSNGRDLVNLRLCNAGVNGERTDQIVERLGPALARTDWDFAGIILQGGINDIVQGAPIGLASENLLNAANLIRLKGLMCCVIDVLPWNNGSADSARLVDKLNTKVFEWCTTEGYPAIGFNAALRVSPSENQMPTDLTAEGNHPSVEGYRRLANLAILGDKNIVAALDSVSQGR